MYFDGDNVPQPKKESSQTTFTAKHIPLSVAIASNVPDFDEPVCFVTDGNSQTLVDKMMTHLEQISQRSFELLKEHFSDVFEVLSAREKEETSEGFEPKGRSAKQLIQQFETYLHQLPVIGFNSSCYDLVVIKPFLFQRLRESDQTTQKERC